MISFLGAAALLCLGWLLTVAVLRIAQLINTFRILSKMPHVKSSSWVGWTEMVRDQTHAPHLLAKAANELGGIFSYRVGHVPGVAVTDPALAHQVLSQMDLPKDPLLYHIFNTLTSPGGQHPNLLGSFQHGFKTHWWSIRKGTAPAFSPKHIRGEFPHVVELSLQICEIISSAGPTTYLDLDNLLQRESMDVIGRIGFATDFGALRKFRAAEGASNGVDASNEYSTSDLDPNDAFKIIQAAAKELVRRWMEPWRMHLMHITPDARRGEAVMRAVLAQWRRLMKEVRARGDPSPDDMSVAAHLLRIRDPHTGLGLTDEQLASEIGVFFFAGFETTGHTMAWTLYFLSTHPECEAAVCAELDALGLLVTPSRPHPRPLEYADLGRLKYLGWAIKESQRLVPVVGQGSPRRSNKPISLGGFTIPAGVTVIVPLQGLHTCSRNWNHPLEFDPGRWRAPGEEYWRGPVAASTVEGEQGASAAAARPAAPGEGECGILEEMDEEDEGKVSRPPLRFIPFSHGRRNCVGQNLAKMNYTATLAILLARFSFKLPPELQGPGAFWDLQCWTTTVMPRNGLPLKAIPKTTA